MSANTAPEWVTINDPDEADGVPIYDGPAEMAHTVLEPGIYDGIGDNTDNQFWPVELTVTDTGAHAAWIDPPKTRTSPSTGDEFTHLSMLDLDWKPGPGQKYADAPKARMRVTSVRHSRVYFTWADATAHHGTFTLPLGRFMERYGDQLPPHTPTRAES